MSAPWLPYLVAVAATLAAGLWRVILAPWLGHDLPYLTFFGAVMAAAWYGGQGPGLLSTALSVGITTAFFLVPRIQAQGLKPAHVVGMLIFAATGLLISTATHRLRRTRDDARIEAERLRTTLQSIGDGVIVTDAAGQVVSLNPVAERLTGWTSAESHGQPLDAIFRIVNESTRAAVENPATRALRDGAIVGLANHTLLIARDGTESPIDDSAAPVRGAGGRIAGSVLVFRDVSERRRTEQTLRASEEELSDFFEHASVGLHWVGVDGRITRANRAELDMLGYETAEYVGRPAADFHVDRAVADALLARLASGEAVRNFPARLRGRDGAIRHVLISSSPRWERGRLVHSRCVVLDVTERRQSDEMRSLLAAVVESTDDAVITKSLEGVVLSWNAGAAAMFGYTAEEMVGRSINRLIPAERREEELAILGRVKRAERVAPFETQRVARDGRVIDVSLTLSPIRGEDGGIIGASSIARDIGQRKALEQSLRDSDRRKDEFLAVLAHELRNPLAPIRSGVAALRLALPDDATLRHVGGIIERQVRQMSRLLDDLLDVSRITHNKLELRLEPLTLQAVVDSALETSRPLVEQAGQTVTLTAPSAPVPIVADPMRMAQVFANLISNASKYSHAGSTIRIAIARDGDEVEVAVTDDGIGIAAEALPSIFDVFSQVSPSRTRAQGGVGIGLSLVKGLVELHGGSVSARSAGLDQGSTFSVRLPVATVAVQATPDGQEALPAGPLGRRVVIADDNRDGADSLALVVRAFGCEVRTAYDGAEAIQVVDAFRPQVIFLDLGMPGMDGLEAARRIRAMPDGKTPLLVAVTGWGQERDRQQTSEAGFDAHVVKPADPFALRALIASAPPAQGTPDSQLPTPK
jgi:PAS domain S-box-containing protein